MESRLLPATNAVHELHVFEKKEEGLLKPWSRKIKWIKTCMFSLLFEIMYAFHTIGNAKLHSSHCHSRQGWVRHSKKGRTLFIHFDCHSWALCIVSLHRWKCEWKNFIKIMIYIVCINFMLNLGMEQFYCSKCGASHKRRMAYTSWSIFIFKGGPIIYFHSDDKLWAKEFLKSKNTWGYKSNLKLCVPSFVCKTEAFIAERMHFVSLPFVSFGIFPIIKLNGWQEETQSQSFILYLRSNLLQYQLDHILETYLYANWAIWPNKHAICSLLKKQKHKTKKTQT